MAAKNALGSKKFVWSYILTNFDMFPISEEHIIVCNKRLSAKAQNGANCSFERICENIPQLAWVNVNWSPAK